MPLQTCEPVAGPAAARRASGVTRSFSATDDRTCFRGKCHGGPRSHSATDGWTFDGREARRASRDGGEGSDLAALRHRCIRLFAETTVLPRL